ncbi:hypothetical protein [Hyphococcus sp.]|uniref:hypothetical protein n=1 Tax=Hyphococcus sp. TaxID=2038636 RepID=UPI003CCC1F31
MMTNELKNQTPLNAPSTDEKSWNRLFDNIRELALHRSETLLEEKGDEKAFDRGARVLRTLMSSAEVAQRMLRNEEKEPDDNETGEPVVSDERAAAIYRKIERQVTDIAEKESGGTVGRGNPQTGFSGGGGDAVETQRS